MATTPPAAGVPAAASSSQTAPAPVSAPGPNNLLAAVQMAPLVVKGSDIVFDPQQTIFAQHLVPCKQIIDMHSTVWFKKKPGATARKLRTASSLVNGLMSTVVSMHDKEQLALHMHAAMRGKQWKDIITCITAFHNASAQDREAVIEHRRLLQNHLLSFLESLQNLYETYLVGSHQISELRWPEFVRTAVISIEEVDVAVDAVDASVEGDAPPTHMYQ